MEQDVFGNNEETSVAAGQKATDLAAQIKEVKDHDWTEKYRPHKLDDLLLPDALKNKLKELIHGGSIRNMVFYSSASGTGKTSTAKVICEELGVQYKFYNSSVLGRVDTIRNEIINYALQKGVNGKHKIVIFDEADGGSAAFFEALRGAIEETHETLRFIFTCNSLHKIPKSIRESRCTPVSFAFQQTEEEEKKLKNTIYKKLHEISFKETGSKDKFDTSTLIEIVKGSYPDVRSMVGTLEFMYRTSGGVIKGPPSLITSIDIEPIWKAILDGNWEEARRLYNVSVSDSSSFFNQLLEFALINSDKKHRLGIASLVAEHQFRSTFQVDQEINVTCGLFVGLINLLKK